MREIKFRAWDSLKEEMNNDLSDLSVWEIEQPETYTTMMQYTGLKDKNGVEIYEGDIIECITISGVNETTKYIGIVEYPDGDSGFFLKVKIKEDKHGKHNINYWTTLKHESNEIIGNIYESPELLESV